MGKLLMVKREGKQLLAGGGQIEESTSFEVEKNG